MKSVAGHPLAIDHLTVLGAGPEEMVEIAAALEVGLIGPISLEPGVMPGAFDLRPGTADTAVMKAALARTGVRINNMDCAALWPETSFDVLRAKLEGAAELGARGVATLSFDPDAGRYFENFCRLGEITRELGLLLVLEFTPLSQLPTLESAVDLVRRAGLAHARVLVDFMHLTLSGGTACDLAGLGADIISGAQICDGPRERTMEQYGHDAMACRQLPGEGEYDFAGILAALPQGVPVALEVPRAAEAEAGMSPLERARAAVDATMGFDR